MAWDGEWPEYVPVRERIARAKTRAAKALGKGKALSPVVIEGRGIAHSFWGKSWCDHMESFRDYENRLPRGKNYVRNGSVVHLALAPGRVSAKVAGSTGVYDVTLEVAPLAPAAWKALKTACAGQVASLLDLLRGRLSDGVMRHVADRERGLFPKPREFTMDCTCPDPAGMCKHIAAVCYGVGARLDAEPELLFVLRGVDAGELAADTGVNAVLQQGAAGAKKKRVAGNLAEIFGLDAEEPAEAQKAPRPAATPARKTHKVKQGRKNVGPTGKSVAQKAKKPTASRKWRPHDGVDET